MDALSFGLAISLHVGFNGDYNMFHPYIQYEITDGYAVGATYNSEHNISLYATKKFDLKDDLFLEAGIATGYEDVNEKYNTPVVPIFRLGYYTNDNTLIWLMASGETDDYENFHSGLVIGTQLKF